VVLVYASNMAIGFHRILSPPQPPHSLPRLQTLCGSSLRGGLDLVVTRVDPLVFSQFSVCL